MSQKYDLYNVFLKFWYSNEVLSLIDFAIFTELQFFNFRFKGKLKENDGAIVREME